MIRSFTLSLLCSSILICASACTAQNVPPEQANLENPPAPVEPQPVESAAATASDTLVPEKPPAETNLANHAAPTERQPLAPGAISTSNTAALETPPAQTNLPNHAAAAEPQPVVLSSASSSDTPIPEAPPAVALKPIMPAADKHAHDAPSKPAAGGLTLDAAIQKALAASPRLRSASASVLASRGDRRQAGLLPNPELGVETENFSGGGPYKGFDSAETTVGITQLIELGGKRGSRKAVAEQGMALSRFDYEAERLNLIRDVTAAYMDAVAAEERLKIAGEQRDLAEQVYKEVGQRVSAAREPLIQQNKAEVTRATSRIGYQTAEREVTQTKRALSALWGGTELIALDNSSLFAISEPPAAPTLETNLAQNPSLTRWDAELKRSQAAFDLERANAIPDPRISVGMRDFRDTGDKAFVAGISIPIPVFNRNQGNIERARHSVSKAESDAQTAKLQIGSELSQRYQEMNIAYGQAESLEHSIIPAAQKSFSLSREGYRAGRFAFLEVLDAQRTLFEAKEQRVAALRNYHSARAEVERLTAKNLQTTAIDEDDHEE